MDEMINKLISIDKQARKRVDEAKKERAKAVEELDIRKATLKDENEEKFKQFVLQQQEQSKNELEKARISIEENKKQAINRLEALYDEKRDEWINGIFNSVTH